MSELHWILEIQFSNGETFFYSETSTSMALVEDIELAFAFRTEFEARRYLQRLTECDASDGKVLSKNLRAVEVRL